MSDTENTETPPEERKRLGLKRPGRLELKKTVTAGQVRQSFSHGRSRAVAVEVKKKRTFERADSGGMEEVKAAEELLTQRPPAKPKRSIKASAVEPAESVESTEPAAAARPAGIVLRSLTDDEKAVRAKALGDSRKLAEEARRRAEEEARHRAVDEERMAREHAEADRRAAEETARKKTEEEARLKAEEAAARRLPEVAAGEDATAGGAREVDEEEARRGRRGRPEGRRPAGGRRTEPRRRSGKLTITQALGEPERVRSLAAVRRQREREKRQMAGLSEEPPKVVREVVIPETITVQELANRMAVRGVDVVKALMNMGQIATINETVDSDAAEILVEEFGHKPKRVSAADVEIGLAGVPDEAGEGKARPPIVTVMGHVDHGKTTLLDALRETDVVGGEAGGITQHIGAYRVQLDSGQHITFLDTPGHEAFTAMRARGAGVTDIVVLVVAADDGVMPQTVEAIKHAQAAKVPIVIAINKADKPGADPGRIRQELLKHEIVTEELGGEALAIEVSATKKTNLAKLEEAILLQAELLDLKANPDRPADGVVIEAKIDPGRGPVATLLVQRGTLRVGDTVVAGNHWGRVRALLDDRGHSLKEAPPTTPIQVLGLGGVPEAGDEFNAVENERRAREISEFREDRARETRVAGTRSTVEEMFAKIAEGELSELPVVVKGDVQGSVEAIVSSLTKLGTDEVAVRVLLAGVGGVTESDVTLAQASNAVIFGFNVRANKQARNLAQQDNVEIRYYSVIYELVDDVKSLLSGLLAPERREKVLGRAEILEVFTVSKVGKIAGCRINEGLARRGARVRLLRDDVVIHEGALSTLRRFKEDVKEVKDGFECGVGLENYQDIQSGDTLEFYEIEEIARTV
jgi:translation initiation factor IF-2